MSSFACIDDTLHSLGRTDPEFAAVLTKWKYLLYASVKRIALVTGGTFEDTFHDLLLPLIRINSSYGTTQYRYAGRVFDFVERDGPVLKLQSSPYCKRGFPPFWIRVELVERIKKASLDSLIYNKIQQEACTLLRSQYVSKKGYVCENVRKEFAKLRNKGYGNNYGLIEKKTMVKTVEEVSLDDPKVISSSSCGFEDLCNVALMRGAIERDLSIEARRVFSLYREGVDLSNLEIQSTLHLSLEAVLFARREIRLAARRILTPSVSRSREPIHLSARAVTKKRERISPIHWRVA